MPPGWKRKQRGVAHPAHLVNRQQAAAVQETCSVYARSCQPWPSPSLQTITTTITTRRYLNDPPCIYALEAERRLRHAPGNAIVQIDCSGTSRLYILIVRHWGLDMVKDITRTRASIKGAVPKARDTAAGGLVV
jgi:hypothetical protein